MKKSTLTTVLCFLALIQCFATNNINVQTIVFDKNSQPPIVGGKISNYSDDNIIKKGIIIGTNKNEMNINSKTTFITTSEFRYAAYSEDYPSKNTKIYDLTNINKEQFAFKVQHLFGNTMYYVKAYAISKDSSIAYGCIDSLKTQNFNRYNGRPDIANVWYAFSYTTFDLITDELINPSTDGFYYSTNESPKTCKKQSGTSYNTCYKFKTNFDYTLWYSHCGNNDMWKSYSTGIYLPIITLKDNKLSITPDKRNSEDNLTIYYSINGDEFRPETYSLIYSEPITIKNPCTICCYAKRSDGNISFPNMYQVFSSDLTDVKNATNDITGIYGMKSKIILNNKESFVYDINGNLIYKGCSSSISAHPGLYIVKVDNSSTKVIVK